MAELMTNDQRDFYRSMKKFTESQEIISKNQEKFNRVLAFATTILAISVFLETILNIVTGKIDFIWLFNSLKLWGTFGILLGFLFVIILVLFVILMMSILSITFSIIFKKDKKQEKREVEKLKNDN